VLSIKDVHSQGEVFFQFVHFTDKGEVGTFRCKKASDGVSERTKELVSADKGVNFLQFYADVFYGRPLFGIQ